jgi:GTP-binding protein
MSVRFVDEARVFVQAGNGGKGCVSFMSIPGSSFKKKPSGGMGGDGGNVIVEGDDNLSTLLDFKYQQHYVAKNGNPGSSSNKTGRCGDDLFIRVPLGTILSPEDPALGHKCEIVKNGQQIIIQKGGEGGRGNIGLRGLEEADVHHGEQVQGVWYNLELKLVADIGVVGLPNAGKSTFVRQVTGAKPKVAEYPFTTLYPVLGVLEDDPALEPLIIADIPGLVEGAHKGVGLGSRFLRHVSRVRCLVFMVDGSNGAEQAKSDLATVRLELRKHDVELTQKRSIVLVNKIDQIADQQGIDDVLAILKEQDVTVLAISAAHKLGLNEALGALRSLVF